MMKFYCSRLSVTARYGIGIVVTAMLLLTIGCSRNEEAETTGFQEQLNACSEHLRQNPLVPIVGGGHLDTRRFDFNVPTVRLADGQCGTDGFETSFYWTGEKIVPAGQRFTGIELVQIPKHWRLLHAGAKLGNRTFCKANPEKCKEVVPSVPKDWPEEFTAHLTHYELDARLPKMPVDHVTHEIAFILRDWPRKDGTPRFITCDIRRDVKTMTRKEIEELEFGTQTLPCQVDFRDFDFKGGAARIRTGTEALREIPVALKALQQYLSASIVLEEK